MEESRKGKTSELGNRVTDHFNELERDIAALDPAWAKAALYFRTELAYHFGHGLYEIRVRSLSEIHQHLEVYKTRFEGGDTLSLLQAVAACSEENLPLPTWLKTAFGDALKGFLQPGGIQSLDTAFFSKDVPTGINKKAATARQDWQLSGTIWHDIWRLVSADEAITSFDGAISRALEAKRYGVSKTKARSLFKRFERNQLEFLGQSGSQTLSRFLEKRRKA